MRKDRFTYLLFFFLFAFSGCLSDDSKDAKKWAITLDPNDKNPYGTYLANESIRFYFRDAVFEPLPKDFHYGSMDNSMKQNESGASLIVFAGLDFKLSDEEWVALKDFVRNGNEVVIFCSTLDKKVEKDLSCVKQLGNEEGSIFLTEQPDLNNKNVLSLAAKPSLRYGYNGRSLKGFFIIEKDSSDVYNEGAENKSRGDEDEIFSSPDTLGYANSEPDFIRYKLGNGHITLHGAPLVLSNYFLLQPGNIDYFTSIWQTLPQNITKIYTHNYYKRNGSGSSLSVLLKYPATRWALILALVALLLYVLFEGKRRQRIIPIIAPLKNDSVSFVETVGRLYYNKGDHRNLANKMSQQFLEWVRLHYFLNTNLLNEEFISQLTTKSGQPAATVLGLVEMICELKLEKVQIDDAYLYQLYNLIQQFYKNHRS
jgi:hypothetical protein